MTRKLPDNPERSFGLSVGTVLLLLAAVLTWRGRVTAAQVTAVIGLVLLAAGWLRPALLKWPSAVWWRFALMLAYVNARVILTLMFALVLTPVGLVWRAIGRDPLALRRSSGPRWSRYPERYRDRKHYTRMY